jgi:hypothetical protein
MKTKEPKVNLARFGTQGLEKILLNFINQQKFEKYGILKFYYTSIK